MGLRFRKSISIFPGVRLNFGKTGMSVSTGVPGFRRTVHTSGKVTTSAGIPGTGIYYVDTRNRDSWTQQLPKRKQLLASNNQKVAVKQIMIYGTHMPQRKIVLV